MDTEICFECKYSLRKFSSMCENDDSLRKFLKVHGVIECANVMICPKCNKPCKFFEHNKYVCNTTTVVLNSRNRRVRQKTTSNPTKVYLPQNRDFCFPSTSRSSSPETNNVSADSSYIADLVDLPSIDEFEDGKRKKSMEEEIKSLKEKLQKSRKKNNNLKTQVTEAKKRIKKLQVSRKMQPDTTLLPEFSRAIVAMQFKSQKRKLWTTDEKKTALSIYYKGPATYKFLRRKNVVLPAISTLKKFRSFSYKNF